MKRLMGFAVRILTLRMAAILLSLAQTTIWAAELGVAGFGLVSAFISAQTLLGFLGRFGADNVLIRKFRTTPHFARPFHGYLRAAILFSACVASIGFMALALPVFKTTSWFGALAFTLLLLSFNVMQIFMQIVLAQKRQALATLFGGVLPIAVSLGLFCLPLDKALGLPRPLQAVAFLGLGYSLSAVALACLLRPFLRKDHTQPAPMQLLLSPEQWYFLAYQGVGLARVNATTLIVVAVFGAETGGVFALALRFGNLLTYLNEPARMYILPRVAQCDWIKIRQLYRLMLGMNAGFCGLGVLALVGLYIFIPLPFSTDPPFVLYTSIIMAGAAVNLCVGPVGAILSQSGHEKQNLRANIAGFCVAAACLCLAWAVHEPLAAVIGVALSSVTINLCNTFSLTRIMHIPGTAS